MWTRKLLKDNAKHALRGRYWRVFLVCLVGTLLTGGLNSTGSSGTGSSSAGMIELGPVTVSTVNPVVQFFWTLLLPLGILLSALVIIALAFVVQALFFPSCGWAGAGT